MRFQRGLAGVAVAAGILAAAAPATAATTAIDRYDTGALFGVKSQMPLVDPIPSTFTTTARGQNLGNGTKPGTLNVSFECAAVAVPSAITRLLQCYLVGLNDGRRIDAVLTDGLVGPADAAAGTGVGVPTQAYGVCAQSRAELVRSTGTEFVDSPLICS